MVRGPWQSNPLTNRGLFGQKAIRRGTAVRSDGAVDSQINIPESDGRSTEPSLIRHGSGTRPTLRVGVVMTSAQPEFVKLLIRRPERGPDKWLVALRATANYYGWAEQFPAWTPRTTTLPDGRTFTLDPGRRGELRCSGGVGMMISRKPPGPTPEKGLVNRCQVSNSCSLFDISEIAHFVNVDWYWMSDPRGGRVSRESWENRYQSGRGLHRRQEEGGMFR